ncbi:MAG: hypothetical protein MJ231_06405, partial [bacterium]|nr:hypothetical protein [bacterium]
MKIQRIELLNVYQQRQQKTLANKPCKEGFCCNGISNICYIPYNISFGFANAEKLKRLFEYGVPCIYTGVEMVDPRKFQKQMKSDVFKNEASVALAALGRYKNTYSGNEAKLFKLLKLKALVSPDKSLKGLISTNEPLYEKILVKKQKPILDSISKLSKELPQKYKEPFDIFMDTTYKKLNKQPVIEPFSTTEFIYKLKKISADEDKTVNTKAAKVMEKLKVEAERLELKTTSDNIENQKKVIDFMEIIRKRSCLKENEQLKSLIKDAQNRLDGKPVIIPFTRKAFIYDLAKLLGDLPEAGIKEKLIDKACELPTSQNSFPAYVVKLSKESSDKIAYRIAWPYFASIEHLLPRSCGGANVTENYAGACSRANSLRESIDFTEQIK